MASSPRDQTLPIIAAFPGLQSLPRATLCTFPSPVQLVEGDGIALWIKRDDLNASVCGGNKARTLEWLLGEVRPGDEVLTLGGEGSTHVLATAVHAGALGARTTAFRWRHDMNPTAERVATRSAAQCTRASIYATSIGAIARAGIYRMVRRSFLQRDTPLHAIPLGGSVPAGVLAHVNAALELAEQIHLGELPRPAQIVVPLGSGGTAAGLILGLSIARLEVPVIGVQVTPRIVANRSNVMGLVRRTIALIERTTGLRVDRLDARQRRDALHIARNAYGGAYGRPIPAGRDAADWLARHANIALDQTYSAKAFAVALALAQTAPAKTASGKNAPANTPRAGDRPTLFWNTFDGRVLAE